MILISHRGNINGPKPELENTISQIEYCIAIGYNVEIDLRFIDKRLYLGHDEPQYEVDLSFLINYKNSLWCHAKNIKAFEFMIDNGHLNCFWNDTDTYALTSKGYIWTYNANKLSSKSVVMCSTLSEAFYSFKQNISGICSDYVGEFGL